MRWGTRRPRSPIGDKRSPTPASEPPTQPVALAAAAIEDVAPTQWRQTGKPPMSPAAARTRLQCPRGDAAMPQAETREEIKNKQTNNRNDGGDSRPSCRACEQQVAGRRERSSEEVSSGLVSISLSLSLNHLSSSFYS